MQALAINPSLLRRGGLNVKQALAKAGVYFFVGLAKHFDM